MRNGVYGSFTLSDDLAIEAVLTDIPLLSVGILSIGVFTFLLALKRVDQLAMYLFFSSFLGFIAAILDLGQILIRGHANAANGLKLEDVAGFVNAREVLLSFSIGFVFLFWWTFVARRPVGLTPQEGEGDSIDHCASWLRWGYVGLALKWSTLIACFLILIFQLVWRLASQHHKYGDIYVATSTLATTISIVFIFKILFNLYMAPPESRRPVLMNYIAPVVALVISAGLGVGNLVLFTFSETALGRFLQAIEIYTLLVYGLIVSFRTPLGPKAHKPSLSIEKRPYTFAEEPQPDVMALQRSVVEAPTYSNDSTSGPSNFLRPWRPSRVSKFSKMSSWLSFSRTSRVPEESAAWPQDKELGAPPQPSLLFQLAYSTIDEAQVTQKEDKTNVPSDAITNSGLGWNLKAPSAVDEGRPLTEISLSYYAMEGDMIDTSFNSNIIQDTSTPGSNSPIYGLDGIIPPRRRVSQGTVQFAQAPTVPRSISGLSPIDDLLQQQSELDRSISVLRGLHNRQNSMALRDEDAQTIAVPKRATLTPSPITAFSKPSSASGQSDFSLSNFPKPPGEGAPAVSNSKLDNIDTKVNWVAPIQIPGIDVASELGTPSQFGMTARFSSIGTQYDVTSFIGGPTSGYTQTTGNIASSSLFRGGTSPSDYGSNVNEPGTANTSSAESQGSPTSTIRLAYPPQIVGTPPSPEKGLGKATMSSSFKIQKLSPVHATELEQQRMESQAPVVSLEQQQSTSARRPKFSGRAGATRTALLPPSRSRFSTSTVSRSQRKASWRASRATPAVPF